MQINLQHVFKMSPPPERMRASERLLRTHPTFSEIVLDGLVNRYTPKWVLAPNLDRKATLHDVGMDFRVFDWQSRHRSIVVGQEPGVVHLVIGEAPWDHLSDCCKVKHPVALSGSSNQA